MHFMDEGSLNIQDKEDLHYEFGNSTNNDIKRFHYINT